MTIVDGKKIAEGIKEEIRNLLKTGEPKSLAIIYVGENPVIDNYVALKKKVGLELGINVEILKFEESVSTDVVLEAIKNAGAKYSGMIVQLPLPAHLNKEEILNAVPAEQDVDVLSEKSFELFSKGESEKMPPVVVAISEIIKTYKIDLANKKIVVVGRGPLVGKPVVVWLSRQNISANVLDSDTLNRAEILKEADIIISGAGVPSLIKASDVKEGVILIDAGTSTASGKIAGDIDQAAYEKAALVSGVPGGIGPITVVSLFKNLFLK